MERTLQGAPRGNYQTRNTCLPFASQSVRLTYASGLRRCA